MAGPIPGVKPPGSGLGSRPAMALRAERGPCAGASVEGPGGCLLVPDSGRLRVPSLITGGGQEAPGCKFQREDVRWVWCKAGKQWEPEESERWRGGHALALPRAPGRPGGVTRTHRVPYSCLESSPWAAAFPRRPALPMWELRGARGRQRPQSFWREDPRAVNGLRAPRGAERGH